MASNGKYLDYPGLVRLVENIEKKYAPIQAVRFVSTVDIVEDLPALNTVQPGWMYNIKTGGITTNDFVEGEGHIIADGENVGAVELITGYIPVPTPYSAAADPRVLGWYEYDQTVYENVTNKLEDDADPQALGLYEESTVTPGTYVLTADTAIVDGKDYFKQVILYKLTTDRAPVNTKTYYEATKVMKWDLMGAVFDLEGRYLEFGKVFPQKPESRMVTGRTFLYMGPNKYVYTEVTNPVGRPSENDYFEGAFTAVTNTSTIVNPRQEPLYEKEERYEAVTPAGGENPNAEGWYESNGLVPPTYALSTDTTVNAAKTYFKKLPDVYVRTLDSEVQAGKTYYTGTFTASTDVIVDPDKVYYNEEILYKKGGVYEYNETTKEWTVQSSGAEVDPIPLPDIDDLFI